MKRRTVFLITAVIGLQIYSVPLMKAEPAASLGSEANQRSLAALLLDSLQTQEPPGISPAVDTVMASYYSRRFHGRKTASGDRFDRHGLTCAHKTLPFNTLIKVTNPKNNQSCIVRVNDRGPFKRNRKLDLSYEAARQIGMLKAGIMRVTMEILPPDTLGVKLVKND
jgi:rare lipoprotein A